VTLTVRLEEFKSENLGKVQIFPRMMWPFPKLFLFSPSLLWMACPVTFVLCCQQKCTTLKYTKKVSAFLFSIVIPHKVELANLSSSGFYFDEMSRTEVAFVLVSILRDEGWVFTAHASIMELLLSAQSLCWSITAQLTK